MWALGNANALDFLQEVAPERTLQLAYEDLVTAPEVGPGRLLAMFIFSNSKLDGGKRVCVGPHSE